MSIEKDALVHLELRTLQGFHIDGTDIPVRLVPKDMVLQSLESFLPQRKRFRGGFTTSYIADFAIYSAQFPGGKCFVDQAEMGARIYFDLGDIENPGHGQNRAHIKLEQTAPFAALLNLPNKQLSQKELAEWLEDWSQFFVGYSSSGEAITPGNVVASIRRVTIAAKKESTTEHRDFKAEKSGFESIEVRSEAELPAGIRFTCIPYHGLDQRSFELRLSVINGDSPRLVLRHVRFEESKEQMANEFSDKLSTALKSAGAEADIYLGEFSLLL